MKLLDMLREVLAIFEIEFILSAFFYGTGEVKSSASRVAQNGRAKLFIYQDAGLCFRHTAGNRVLKSVVDDLLGCGDLRSLLLVQLALPTKHA